ERIAARLARGKVDITVRLRAGGQAESLQVDHALLGRLAELHMDLAPRFAGLQVQTTELLRYPSVLRAPRVDAEAVQSALIAVLGAALSALAETREREGAKLAAMLHELIDGIEALVKQVREWVPEIRAALRERLLSRLADLKRPA